MGKREVKTIKLPKQKDYPRSIFFGTEEYKIIFKKGLDCYGETNASKRTILIKHGMSPRNILTTFVHELLHVLEFERPIKLKHKTVYKLETAIVEILLDNFL